jgi:hypothetical protein
MNRAFDYNGTIISPSKPTTKLTTLRRVVHLDSGDRDSLQYPTNGDMVLYLPRTYEKVVGIRIKGAEFPGLVTGVTGNYYVHDYGSTGATGVSDYTLGLTGLYSIFLDVENLNRADETSPRHDRSSFTDSTFAKFQLPYPSAETILHNESSSIHNETYYTPPLGKLDRLRLVLRTHKQKDSRTGVTGGPGFIYSSGWKAGQLEYGLTLEIETLENSFDDYSSMETRVLDKNGGFWNSSSQ